MSEKSIVKTEPGCKPIMDPNRATPRELRDRIAYLVAERRKRVAGRSEINRQIAIIDRESGGLVDAHIAATARALANGGRA